MINNVLYKYAWLIETILKAKRITFDELNKIWMDENGGESIPRRTFHSWRIGAEEAFGVNIECERRKGYTYYIDNIDDIKNGSLRYWLLNTLSVGSLLLEYKNMKDNILLEDIPSGYSYLPMCLKALKARTALKMEYQSFRSTDVSTFTLYPYCIKLFKRRWYVVGYSSKHHDIRTYSLDRIHSLSKTGEKYRIPRTFNAKEYFDEFHGVITDDSVEMSDVKLKVIARQAHYMRSLPIHPSQKEISRTDEYSIFQLRVRPTLDFKQELLSLGATLEVLSPGWLRQDFKETLETALKGYNTPPPLTE